MHGISEFIKTVPRCSLITTEARNARNLGFHKNLDLRVFINPSDDALGQDRHIEIDEQTHPQLAEPQISQQLGLVDGSETLNGLQFDDDPLTYDEINSVSASS